MRIERVISQVKHIMQSRANGERSSNAANRRSSFGPARISKHFGRLSESDQAHPYLDAKPTKAALEKLTENAKSVQDKRTRSNRGQPSQVTSQQQAKPRANAVTAEKSSPATRHSRAAQQQLRV